MSSNSRRRQHERREARKSLNNVLWAVVATLLVCLLLAALVYGHITRSPAYQQTARLNALFAGDPERALKVSIRRQGENYLNTKTKVGKWWLETRPDTSAETFRLLNAYRQRVLGALARHKDLNGETREMAAVFTNFRTAVLDHDQVMFYDSYVDQLKPLPEYTLCFVPLGEAQRTGKQPDLLVWYGSINTMQAAAYDFPDKLFDAAVIHECGHGLRHSVHKEPDGDEPQHATEEVEMHALSSEVINATTGGEYFKAVDAIITRGHPKTVKEAIASITLKDVLNIDRIVGIGNGDLEARYLLSECYYTVGARWVDQHGGSTADKAAFYAWFISWSSKSEK